MKTFRWPTYDRGDFLPIMIGVVLLFLSLPAFVLLLADTNRAATPLEPPLLVLFGIGNLLGIGHLVFGLRLCSYPGSLLYRATHCQIFSR